jgi:hypothetical protein
MALIIKDRVKESTTTSGTGDITLAGSFATFDSFNSYMTNGDTSYYAIEHTSSGVDEWEVGLGTWNTGNTLSRTTVLAGSAGTSAVDFSAGTKNIFMTYPSAIAAFTDGSGDLSSLIGLGNHTTTDLAEGSNLYFNTGRIDTHLNTGTATTGEVLSWTGTDYDWIAAGGGGAALELYAESIGTGGAIPTAPTADAGGAYNSVAIGNGADIGSGRGESIAIGTDALTNQSQAIALGKAATVGSGGSFATALGRNSLANGTSATAIGTSYASGTDSFAAAIASNSSSYGATGANSVAMGPTAKASSSGAVSLGGISGAPSLASNSLAAAIGWATASGSGSFAVGSNSQATATQINSVAISGNATATYSTAIGKSSDNSNAGASGSGAIGLSGGLAQGQDSFAALLDARSVAANSVAIGSRARANQIGKYVFANGRFAAAGDVQTGTSVLRSDTTDATAEDLTTDNGTAGTTNQIILPNNSAYFFSGTIIARQSAATGTDVGAWEIKGAIRREANAASTVLVKSTIDDFNIPTGWAVALTADTTNGGLAITVTGAAATNIRWVATVNTSEVTY